MVLQDFGIENPVIMKGENTMEKNRYEIRETKSFVIFDNTNGWTEDVIVNMNNSEEEALKEAEDKLKELNEEK